MAAETLCLEDNVSNYDIPKLITFIENNCDGMCEYLLSVHGPHQKKICNLYRDCYKNKICSPMPIEWFCCMIYSICNNFYSDITARPETIIPASIHYHRKWDRQWLLTDVPKKNIKSFINKIDKIDKEVIISKYIQCEYIMASDFYTDAMKFETERIFINRHNKFLNIIYCLIAQKNTNIVPVRPSYDNIIYWATVNIPTPNQYGDYYEFGIQFQLARNELYIPTTQFGIRTSCLFNTSAHQRHLQQMKTPQSYELDTAEQSMTDTMFISPQYRFNLPLLDYEKHKFVSTDTSIDTVITDINNAICEFIKFATELILKV